MSHAWDETLDDINGESKREAVVSIDWLFTSWVWMWGTQLLPDAAALTFPL